MPNRLRYEVRDPIHGFVGFTEWERDIINHPVFQRLRRIRQLGLTDMVYPGAMHTRFEHSLGVMHLATRMFDEITDRCKNFLAKELHFDEASLKRERTLVRIAGLLHDVGHSPFSHAGEELMPVRDSSSSKTFKHEDYSAAAIEEYLKWDDWYILGMIASEKGGEHGACIGRRHHHRAIEQTTEHPDQQELERLEALREKLDDKVAFVDKAASSWYKFDSADIPILLNPGKSDESVTTLSSLLPVVHGLKAVNQRRIYAVYEHRDEAKQIVAKFKNSHQEVQK